MVVEKKRLAFKAIGAIAGVDVEGKIHGTIVLDGAVDHK